MEAQAHESLSGFWSGRYSYPDPIESSVPFNVVITETEGGLVGECVEPNTFSPDQQLELFSSLSGARSDLEVRFVKAYEGATYADHEVSYEGVANVALTKIEGVWRVDGLTGVWTGGFVMSRLVEGEEAKASEAEQEI